MNLLKHFFRRRLKISKDIPRKPRNFYVIKKAHELIKAANVQWLPINPFDLVKQFQWKIATVGYISKQTKFSREQILADMESDDSVAQYCNGLYGIIYNERAYRPRITYSIAHEIGHIYLKHLEDYEQTRICRNGLNENEYYVLEKEAELFAAELLMPLPVLKKMSPLSHREIMRICHVSQSAALNRERFLEKPIYYKQEMFQFFEVYRQFLGYLSPVSICSRCNENYKIFQRESLVIHMEKHLFVPTDASGRFNICPQCGNTVFSPGATYCKICGLYLFNDCQNEEHNNGYYSDCGRRNTGDARYCEFCGAQTWLTYKGLIMTWEEVLQANKEVAVALDPDIIQKEEEEPEEPGGINLNNLPF